MPAAAATTVVRPYSNLLRVSRWGAVLAGVMYAAVHQGTLEKRVKAEEAARQAHHH